MVEPNPALDKNQALGNYEVTETERFYFGMYRHIQVQNQVCPKTTEMNYNNPLVGVSEYDNFRERDVILTPLYELLIGGQKEKREGVCQMLNKLDCDKLRMSRQNNILESVQNWQAFIKKVDERNLINVQTLQEGVDKRVKTLTQIDQRMADLYLRCKLKDCYRSCSYQFIFKDGSRSQCEKFQLVPDPSFWRDYIIPEGTEISTVQMMFNWSQGKLEGLRFLDRNSIPIFIFGRMVADPNCLDTPTYLIKEFKLHEGQRIVGFKCASDHRGGAVPGDLQFDLMAPITKTVLLKLQANKQLVSYTGRGIGKLPEGVFREVIKYVQY